MEEDEATSSGEILAAFANDSKSRSFVGIIKTEYGIQLSIADHGNIGIVSKPWIL